MREEIKMNYNRTRMKSKSFNESRWRDRKIANYFAHSFPLTFSLSVSLSNTHSLSLFLFLSLKNLIYIDVYRSIYDLPKIYLSCSIFTLIYLPCKNQSCISGNVRYIWFYFAIVGTSHNLKSHVFYMAYLSW